MISNLDNYNKGTIALQKNNPEKAIRYFKKEAWKSKELYLNMGNAYRLLDMPSKAIDCYNSCSLVSKFDGSDGEYPEALCNLGLIAYALGDDDLAEQMYLKSLMANPNGYDAIWNYSSVLLRRWCSGSSLDNNAWNAYSYRFKAVGDLKTQIPMWDRVSKVETLVVLAEQGLGDKLMFSRYFPLLKEKCDRLILELPKTLWGLFPEYECVESFSGLDAVGVPIGDLAWVFGIVDPCLSVVGEKMQGFNVLVEWAGSPTHKNDRHRSCYPNYFRELAQSGINLWNIRPGAPSVKGIEHIEVSDFSESAKIVAGMDLVISVDTSLVHLSGSLGVETWMMQPRQETDFRWGNPATKKLNGMGIESNIWYPSVRVLENNGWDNMFNNLKKRLDVYYRKKQMGRLYCTK